MIGSRGNVAAALALTALCAAAPARAEGADDCSGYGELKDRPDLAMARIVSAAARVAFVKGASAAKTCPNGTDACRDKAYLVPGNAVIAGRVRDGFTCVDYVGATGEDRAGWIPAAAVARDPAQPVRRSDWVGAWTRDEADIAIKPAAGETLAIHGEATFGSHDPDRVKRGGVNLGEIEARMAPSGADLAFDMKSDTVSLPVGEGDEGDCKVWMRRLGPYLLVSDNNMCGGMNVSFSGIYRRKP